MDRTTKVLLGLIAFGLFANVATTAVMQAMYLSSINRMMGRIETSVGSIERSVSSIDRSADSIEASVINIDKSVGGIWRHLMAR